MAKTIHMGLNTEPRFELPDKYETFDESNKDYWRREVERATALKEEIEKVMAEEGTCELSWSCDGRTRHQMHAQQWASALPQFNFEITYNYGCTLTTKGAE